MMREENPTAQVRFFSDWPAWLQWVLVTAWSGALGWLLASILLVVACSLGGLAVGFVAGLSIGLGQQTFFENRVAPRFPHGKMSWITATFLGGGLSWLVLFVLNWMLRDAAYLIRGALAYGVSGVLLGSMQWLVIRSVFRKSLWWIVLNCVGYLLGGFLGLTVGEIVHLVVAPRGIGIVLGPWEALAVFVAGTIGTIMLALVTSLGIGKLYEFESQDQQQ
jgi:hypothetical protein